MTIASSGSVKGIGTFTPRSLPFGELLVLKLICVQRRMRGTLGGLCGQRVGGLLCHRAHLQKHLST